MTIHKKIHIAPKEIKYMKLPYVYKKYRKACIPIIRLHGKKTQIIDCEYVSHANFLHPTRHYHADSLI